jgi:hypothetical protein
MIYKRRLYILYKKVENIYNLVCLNINAVMPIKCGMCDAQLLGEIGTCPCGVKYVSFNEFLGSQPDITSVLPVGIPSSMSFHPPK